MVSGTMAWDGASNNRAFIAGDLWLTQNGVSIYYATKTANDARQNAIAADIQHADMPHGVAGRAPSTALTLMGMVPRYTRFPNAATDYLRFMMEAEQYDPWLIANLGYWAQPLAAYKDSAVWTSDPKVAIFRDSMNNEFWNGYKGPISEASGQANAEYVMVQMCASVASGQATPEAAAREAERRARRIFRR